MSSKARGEMYRSPLFKQHFYVKHDSYNTLLLPESVYGSQVLNEGNRNEFLLAYFQMLLNGVYCSPFGKLGLSWNYALLYIGFLL